MFRKSIIEAKVLLSLLLVVHSVTAANKNGLFNVKDIIRTSEQTLGIYIVVTDDNLSFSFDNSGIIFFIHEISGKFNGTFYI
jgi:hypothetical protein